MFSIDRISSKLKDIKKHVTLKPGSVLLEIGSFEGLSAIKLCELLKPSKMVCVDPFVPLNHRGGATRKEIMRRFRENTKGYLIELHVQYSMDFLRTDTTQYDFIYIDGNHSTRNVIEDLIMSFVHIKKGGYMLLDDYLRGKDLPKYQRAKAAIDFFLKTYEKDIDVIYKKREVLLKVK